MAEDEREIVKQCIKAQQKYLKDVFCEYGLHDVLKFEEDGVIVETEDENVYSKLPWDSLHETIDEKWINIATKFAKKKETLNGFLPEIANALKIDLNERISTKNIYSFYKDVVTKSGEGFMIISSYENWLDEIDVGNHDLNNGCVHLLSFVENFREQFADKEKLSESDVQEMVQVVAGKKRKIDDK